ncbi:MAG: hypothetical protein IT209_10710 [Armatimonadetes bacterium]|nr:hypothetical protein [Armatimonadota bacterium]
MIEKNKSASVFARTLDRFKIPLVVSAGVVVVCGAVLAATAPKVSAFAPVDYFQAKCASCHGKYGAMMLKTIVKRSDAQLKQDVQQMAAVHSRAPLSGDRLSAEIAYNRSLKDGKPFVILTSATSSRLAGEMTPGSAVTVKSGATSLKASASGHQWSVSVPKKFDISKAAVTVKNGKGASTIQIAKQAYSHAKG